MTLRILFRLLFCVEFIKTLEQHGTDKVQQFCPGFADDYKIVLEANELVKASREDRRKRLDAYRKLADDHLPKLMEFYKRLVEIRELALTEPISREIRNLRWKIIWTRRIVMVGAVASILALVLGVLFWIYPWSDFSNQFHHAKSAAPIPIANPSSPVDPNLPPTNQSR